MAQAPAEPDGLFNAGTGDNGWATGISLAESAMDTYKGFAEGNWIEAGLGTVGLVADAASLAVDPFGTLLSSAASFLMEHMQPLKQMLDWLAGNPPVIDSYSQTWNNVAEELKAVAADYASAVATGTEGWTGPAAEAYHRSAAEHGDALSGAASAAGAVGTVVGLMGMVVAFVREFVRDLIADLVGKLIAWVLEAVFSLGFGTPVIVAQAITAISKWGARIAEIVQKLLNTIKKVSPMIARLVEVFEKIAKVVGKIAGKVTGLDVLHPSSVIPGGFVRRGGGGGVDLPGGSTPGGRGDGPDAPGSDAPGSPDSPATPDGPGADTPDSARPTTNTPDADTPDTNTPRTDTSAADTPGTAPRGTTPESGAPSRTTQPDGGTTPSPSSRPAADTTTSSHAPVDTPTSAPRRDVGDPMPSTPRPSRDPDLPAGNTPSGTPGHPNTPNGGGTTPRPDVPSPTPRGQTTTSSSTPDAPPRPTHPAAPQHTQPAQPQIPTQPTHAGGTPSSSGGGTPNTAPSGAPRQGGPGWTGTPGQRGDLNSGVPTNRTPDPARPSNHTPGHTGTSNATPAHTPSPHTPTTQPHGTPGTPHSPNTPGHNTTPSANTPNHSPTPSGTPHPTRPTAPTPDGARPRAAEPWTPPRQDAPHRTPDAGRPDPSRPDAGRPDAPHPAQNRPDAHHPDPNRPDAPDNGVQPHHDTPPIDEAHARHGETTPSGVSHHRGDPTMGDLPHRVPADPRYFTADVHITPDGRARIGPHTYTPEQYGDLLRRTGWDGRTPIRLIGCDAGSNTFADRLARHTNADVLAPTKPAWTDNAGRVYTSDAEVGPDGTRRPRIPPNGEWNTHRPDGTTTRAGDDGYVPGTRDTDRADHTDADDARDRAMPRKPVNDSEHHERTPQRQAVWDPPTQRNGEPLPEVPLSVAPDARVADLNGRPPLEPNSRMVVTDTDGNPRGIYYTDSGRNITHIETNASNSGFGKDPFTAPVNPDLSNLKPGTVYRVELGHNAAQTFEIPSSREREVPSGPAPDATVPEPRDQAPSTASQSYPPQRFEGFDSGDYPPAVEWNPPGDQDGNYRMAEPVRGYDTRQDGPFSLTDTPPREPNTRYDVYDPDGKWHGTFYTDENGRFSHVHTWSGNREKGFNPELGTAATWKGNLDVPRPETTYAVGPRNLERHHYDPREPRQLYRTDEHGDTIAASGRPEYPPAGTNAPTHWGPRRGFDSDGRLQTDVGQIATGGKNSAGQWVQGDYNRPSWTPETRPLFRFAGGHIIAFEAGGPGERINHVPQWAYENSGWEVEGRPKSETWRGMEEDLASMGATPGVTVDRFDFWAERQTADVRTPDVLHARWTLSTESPALNRTEGRSFNNVPRPARNPHFIPPVPGGS
ncbi:MULTISPECIES: hypothetical protein [Actinosynnema]|uniref:PPE domain-containing protein n=1 Tax=Actinosynnema TaxID=40566 RepID=UPI0020A2DE8A|nr:hypothetical protein [Actinosynnema pretiosum]